MSLQKNRKPDKPSVFNFELNGKELKCFSKNGGDCQFAIANDRGDIILKDYFKNEVSIPLSDFEPGPYKIVVLNEKVNEDFSFYIK